MRKKVYLAAQFARQDEIRRIASKLASFDLEVGCHWMDEKPQEHTRRSNAHHSALDLEDVIKCDLFVLINPPPYCGNEKELARGGRMYEAGFADAINVVTEFMFGKPMKELVCIGNNDCIHLAQSEWQWFNTVEEFLNVAERRYGSEAISGQN
jgi:hypothetical protein